MIKPELRKIYLEKRRKLSSEALADISQRIAARFFEACDLSSVGYLHCFLPIAKFQEIDASLIYGRIWREYYQIMTVVPRIDFERGEIVNVAFDSAVKVIKNKWGIAEPSGGVFIEPDKIDLVIVPLLCFDEVGNRVGYGKGFYDRFLSKCRPDCTKIGLSHFPPVAKIEDVNGHDVKLDICVTPDEIFRF